VLITGAGRAIGRATATELVDRGHHVVATARDVALLADLGVAQTLSLDVADPESVATALAAAGELDAVVNNAGITGSGPLEDFPIERLQAVLETNAVGPLRVIQPLLAGWRARRSGVVVNVSSVQGRVAPPLEGAYAASKHALEAISEVLHLELGHFGIRVVIVEPGYIAPGMKHTSEHRGPEAYAPLHAQWEDIDVKVTGPGGRPGPELVARAIADAIEDPSTPLRVPVGEDATAILALRGSLDDEAFEDTMRQALDIDW